MPVLWDPAKAEANFLKHGVHFSDAEGVLFDPLALTREDESSEGEPRQVSIGQDFLTRVVVVVYAHRADAIRLISARLATRKERRQYEEAV